MNDITLLYCTANALPEDPSEKIRQNLLKITQGKYPIVSVSHKKINFGKNICVGKIEQSCYNFFKQMLLGAQEVKTKYIANVDDDTLYVPEHFTHRPSREDVFTYNTNTWFGGNKDYWRRQDMSGMFCHICPTKALIANLSVRFDMYPTPPQNQRFWGEPGKFDTEFGITNAVVETFATVDPLITFEYRGSLNGKRKRFAPLDPNNQAFYLKPYGDAVTLRKEYWNE
jgi:hypothetical protein